MVNHIPLTATTDPRHGGRWTSLRGGAREWLWHRPHGAREPVRPGDAFVDAGGLEECLPTIRGNPDHGHAWSRPWQRTGGEESVECPDFVLHRRIRPGPQGLRAFYRLSADPGYRFLWAAHALLDVTPDARLTAPAATATRVFPEAAHLIDAPWPDQSPYLTGHWPTPLGLPLERLGPDDGTAVGAILTGCPDVSVTDGPDTLRLTLHTAADVPLSIALWRNLRGYPAAGPYRSIGVEPMLGSVFDLAEAGDNDAATVPASGELRWELDISATRTPPPGRPQ
ncbi:hypothetical protein OHA84_36505 [Streptomyces sp. NBC_00513]|uniref:hypothetical protein n=1 Tax=unclassified Streptomyces TaxID=2593676 RepID=UPI002256EF75|nr:hypothetical protein [Streptomyces sp. NBC_00424]MCX5070996.1 hypothetical protein [Streptomyces sp. NBC_00424]WUD45569.1 hypothetical protein OHA84_36505 [Streptomyces sp. NBC_00513]